MLNQILFSVRTPFYFLFLSLINKINIGQSATINNNQSHSIHTVHAIINLFQYTLNRLSLMCKRNDRKWRDWI